MAVFDRLYRPYAGPFTAAWSRFLVITRYAMKDVFKSRVLVIFFTLCFVFPLVWLGAIYLRHNADLLDLLGAMGADVSQWIPIDGFFFSIFMRVQGSFAFFLVLFIGPRLVSRDLANNGLALYLSRPFSQAEYVGGKVTILAGLTSLITWVPGMLLVGLQVSLEGVEWLSGHAFVAPAILIGYWMWILVISFLALATLGRVLPVDDLPGRRLLCPDRAGTVSLRLGPVGQHSPVDPDRLGFIAAP
jgi:ABC-type transport system involved in multi-copper enzyme maturation permease subunit